MTPLQVFTARISYSGPDRFDVTRKSGGPEGHPFAPSWAILGPALEARKKAARLREVADGMTGIVAEVHAAGVRQSALDVERRAWAAYVPAFLAEMRASYRQHHTAWDALLARPRVVLVCYCADPQRCHRRILAGEILPKLGAVDGGELEAPARRKLRDRVSRADLSDHDRAEVEKFERYLRLMAKADGRPTEALYDAVYGEDETGPRDFRVRH